MTAVHQNRGGAPVGHITDLDGIGAASVIYLRLWCEGPETQQQVRRDLTAGLGAEHGRHALQSFDQLCGLCLGHGRRPLMRHSVACRCLGADESCFANFVAAAALGEREDAMLMATLLVRHDVAPLITALASDFGLALKRMHLGAPVGPTQAPRHSTTLH